MNIKTLSMALIILFCCFSCQNSQQSTQNEAETYELLTIKSQNTEVATEFSATIRGRQDIRIIPRVEGYLQEIHIKEGDKVKKGQLLFRLDDVGYRASVEAAQASVQQMKASLAKAQLEYDGKKSLYKTQIVSDFELTSAKNDLAVAQANLAAAQASLSLARNNLSFTQLHSPSDGIVGRIPYRKGDFVSSTIQDGLTIIADNGQMRVYFSMTEKRIMEYLSQYKSLSATIENMPKVKLQFPNGSFYEKTGRVESISGVLNDQTGAVSVCAVFENPDGLLLSGGTGKVVMPSRFSNAIVIPQEATYNIQDKIYVFKVIDGKAVSAIVEVEPQNDGKNYIVTKGLAQGEIIIAKGVGFIQEGTSIKIN